MSRHKKSKVHKHDHSVDPKNNSQNSIGDKEHSQPDEAQSHNHGDSNATKHQLRKVAAVANSKNFNHLPDNVKKYHDTHQKIKQRFKDAQGVPNNHQKNRFTGEIGELATEKSLYALRGTDKVTIHESKVGGNRNNGIDHVATKGPETFVIETKATRVGNSFELTQTKTQGQQMSQTWIEAKIKEMTGNLGTPGTTQTATLLNSHQPTKHISGVDVDYHTQTVRLVTDGDRYVNLPHDVTAFSSARVASHLEMHAMRTVNVLGKAAEIFGYALDAAEVVGQVAHDIRNFDFGGTARVVLEKGCGYAGGAAAVAAADLGSGGWAILGSFVIGGEGYKLGKSFCSDVADTVGLPSVSDAQSSQNTRDGMDILAGSAGVAVVDELNSVSEKISEGVDSGCEILNDNLPFDVCTPAPKQPILPQTTLVQGTHSSKEYIEPNASYPSESESVNSTQPTVSNSSVPEELNSSVNASYPSNSDELTCKPEKNVAENSQGIHARRTEIMQSRANSENNSSAEKPMGFHARRLAIMHAQSESKSTPENSQSNFQQCEVPDNNAKKSLVSSTETESTYESPRPSPF